MKRSLLLALFLGLFVTLLLLGSQSSQAGGQSQAGNSSSANQSDGQLASEQKENIVIGSSRKTGGATDLEEEETEPDPQGSAWEH